MDEKRRIQTSAELQQFCQILQDSEWLAVDTEFLWEKTYYPSLCLIQIANSEHAACIDPLALNDAELQPLFDILFDQRCLKVMHASDQDLAIFYHRCGAVPGPVFDTQLAAALLGYGEQIGYAQLVHSVLRVELDKSQNRTDWQQRPLHEQQWEYAFNDVWYLRELYPILIERLQQHDRLDWLDDDFRRLSDPALYATPTERLWQKVAGANQLKGVQLNVLKHLAIWREQQAMRLNKPRRWVVADAVLLSLARQLPKNKQELQSIRGFDGKLLQRAAEHCLQSIVTASTEPKEYWPTRKKPVKYSTQQEALVDMLHAVLRLQAAAHHISPALLATRKQLGKLVLGERDLPILHGWRRKIAGEHLLNVLTGTIGLYCLPDANSGACSVEYLPLPSQPPDASNTNRICQQPNQNHHCANIPRPS